MITVIVVGVAIWRRRDAELKRFIDHYVQKKYPHLEVKIASASFVENQGVRLRGLHCSVRDTANSLIDIDEVFIECPLSVKSLIYRDFVPKQIVINHAAIHLPSADGTGIRQWAKHFTTDDKTSVKLPMFPILINGGRVAFPNRKKKEGFCSFESINLGLYPPGTVFEDQSVSNYWVFTGGAENSTVKHLEFRGEVTEGVDDWNVKGLANNVDAGPDMLSTLLPPGELAEKIETFAGKTSCTFTAAKDTRVPTGVRFKIEGELFQGNIALAQLEHPISNIFIRYAVDESSIKLSRITGRSGPILFLADYTQDGLDSMGHGLFRAQLEELPLSNRTVEKLAPFVVIDAAALKDRYEFSATAKTRFEVERKDGKWHPRHVELTCNNLSVWTERFPYRLTGLVGNISLDERATLKFRFDSAENDQSLKIAGMFQDALTDANGRVDIEARGYPIDERLIKSLPEDCRHSIAKLNAEGLLDANMTIRRLPKAEGIASSQSVPEERRRTAADTISSGVTGHSGSGMVEAKRLQLELYLGVRNGSMRFERFPYRITNVTGLIARKIEDHWEFPGFRGKAGSADIVATGALSPNPRNQDNLVLNLRIDTKGLAFDEQLRSALALYPQYEIIRSLNVRGKANASIQIRYEAKTDDFSLAFEAEPIPEVTSIRPEVFPCEISHVQGKIIYREGEVIAEGLRGRNRQMSYSTGLRCRFNSEGGGWEVVLSPLYVDQIQLDREMQSAFPKQMLALFDHLRLKGFFNLSGTVRFRKASHEAPLETSWDTSLILQQNEIAWKNPVHNICGQIGVRGLTVENKSVQIHGELDLDSLNVKNIQATRITGPFYFNGNQLLFGRTVPHPSELNMYLDEFLRKQLFNDPKFQQQERQRTGTTVPGSAATSGTGITRGQNAQSAVAPGFGQTSTPQSYHATPLKQVQVQPVKAAASSVLGLPPTTVVSADELVGRRPVNALLFGGPLYLNGLIQLQEVPVYQIGFLLKDAKLSDFTRDLSPNSKKLDGKITLFSQLQGEGETMSTIKGEGGLIIKEAALYEVPQIVKILQFLSVREPDQAAFNSSFVDFAIIGKRLQLNRVFLEGNSLSLFGSGWLTLEGQDQILDLTMNSRLGNARNQMPVLSDVIGGAGDQISQIKINGPLSDPVVRAERFPGIKKAWWSIFPQDAESGAAKTAVEGAATPAEPVSPKTNNTITNKQ